MDRWIGKTAVVTGAGGGMGAAISVGLANAGLHVVGLDKGIDSENDLKSQIKGDGSLLLMKCDVSKPDAIAEAFQWVEENRGGTDLLVNNAGVLFPGHITDLASNAAAEECIIATIDINLKALILCNRRAIASMEKRNFDGHVININSVAGHYVMYQSGSNVYSCSKHGVTAFIQSLRNELADCKSRIKVTSVSPGLVNTSMGGSVAAATVDFKALEPKDVADVVLYVLSTPPNINISEITVQPVAEKLL